MRKRIIGIITIVLFYSSSFIYSQDISLFVKENTFSYEGIELKINNVSKRETLNKLLETYPSSNLDEFHPFYLNNDSLIDFIYDGPIITNPGLDGNQVLFFENKENGKFEVIASSYGSILKVKRDKVSGSTLFITLDEGCCLSITFDLNFMWMIENNDELSFTHSSPIQYNIETLYFPKHGNIEALNFKVLHNNYNLRSSPFIQDDNIIEEYHKGDRGVVVSTFKSDERVWWFVIMDNKVSLSRKCGWMSSRYLESY
ncbi:hypothetical protein [Flammeovirga pacifica]|nr:hypothetical protein [Flammeovirga pacifica]